MAKKLRTSLQTPVVELVISAEDVSGIADSITCGFRRYTNSELANYAKEESFLPDSFKGYARIEDIPADILLSEMDFLIQRAEKTIERIKKDILYIKKANLLVFDDSQDEFQTPEKLFVEDSRKVEPNSFWAGPSECLSVLVDHLFDSPPWKDAIQKAHNRAINNIPEAKIKN